LLVVSHSAVTQPHLRKWRDLARIAGWPLVVAVPRLWPEGGAQHRPVAQQSAGLRVAPLKTWFAGTLGWAVWRGLDQLVEAVQPAAVYAEEEPFIPLCGQALHAARRRGLPFGFFTWENQVRPYRFWQRNIRRAVMDYASLAVAGNSEAAGLLRQGGYARRLVVLPQYGVEIAARAAPPDGPFTVGYAGRLVPEKGVHVLINAMAGKGWRLLVAGTGPQPYAQALRGLARKRGVQAEFLGYQDEAGMGRFYAGLHALALPSLETPAWKEQFGRVLTEAMAREIACVASDSGAIGEVAGKAGLLAPPGDAPALGAALAKLAASAALRRRLGQAGKKRVARHYTASALAKAMKQELTQLRGNKK
jgi:glycosyltransferase involved in cell wall biosynthesis